MPRGHPLSFDPIEEAARQWSRRWTGVPQMRAVTSLMRVQQIVLAELAAGDPVELGPADCARLS